MEIETQIKPWKKMSELERTSKFGNLKVFEEKKKKPFYKVSFGSKEIGTYQLTVNSAFNPLDVYCDITRNRFIITKTEFQL